MPRARSLSGSLPLLLAALLLACTGSALRAQPITNPNPPPSSNVPSTPDGPGDFGGMPPGDHMPPDGPPSMGPDGPHRHHHFGPMHGLQLGPPGKWWDDKSIAKDIGLSADQQRHMDTIFTDNRSTLVARFHALRDEESRMDTLTHSTNPDERALFAQIDRLAQARANVEKAFAHMLLSMRHEMTPAQIARLDSHR